MIYPSDRNEDGLHQNKIVFMRGCSFPDYAEIEIWPADEEDHEAVCKLFNTIGGSTIDIPKVEAYIDIYFSKITHFSEDMILNAISCFLYQDLIDLRRNRWKAR